MKPFLILPVALLVFACGEPGTSRGDSAAAAPALLLSDVAGRWSARAMSADGDSVLVTYTLTATAEPTGWILELPGRSPMSPRIEVDGDSIILTNGPYESVLHNGVMVTTNGILRLVDERLVGTTIARYAGPGIASDSAVRLRIEATRAQ